MAQLFAIFRPKNHFQLIVSKKHLASHTKVSKDLLIQIQNHPKEFAEYITLRDESLSEIEKLTLVHLLAIHAPTLNDLLESLVLGLQTEDAWIHQNFLVPYQNFLRKLLLSQEQHIKVLTINQAWNSNQASGNSYSCKATMREAPSHYFNFQVLCYCVNMLKQLFGFLKKVPTLGRYYPCTSNSPYSIFVYTSSYHTVLFYFALKFVANQLLLHHQKYLPSPEKQQFLKEVLGEPFQAINEELKNLLLNKYYNPIEKGIKVTLFELERQSENTRQALEELNILQSRQTRKDKKNRQFLGRRIFGKGHFDSEAFQESLMWISSRNYQQNDLQEIYEKENIRSNQQSIHENSNKADKTVRKGPLLPID